MGEMERMQAQLLERSRERFEQERASSTDGTDMDMDVDH